MDGGQRWRWAALGGVVGPVAFVTAWFVGGLATDGYEPTQDAISRLAAVGADTRWWMTTGFLVFTAGTAAAGVALRRAVAGWSWLGVVGTGLATAAVAATPLDRSEAVDLAHGVAATTGYVAFVLAAALAARPLSAAGHRGLAGLSVVAAAVGGACLALTTLGGADGGFQRAGLSALDLWLVTLSLTVLTGRVGPAADR